MNTARALAEKFQQRFGTSCSVYRAPGRVNLIGEHTDYNGGFVLPAAIDFSCWAAIRAREDRRIAIYSANFDDAIELSLDVLPDRAEQKWHDYPVGVARALQLAGKRVRGADLYLSSDIPLGAGLSSSAALEVAAGFALLTVSGISFTLRELAQLSQLAENDFVGARCGIMDQFVSCFGQPANALLLDCRSLSFESVPIPASIHLVICNTMVKHHLASSEYNLRRAQCEEAVSRLRRPLPQIQSLRDVTLADLHRHQEILSPTLVKRARHVISENDRTRECASALAAGNWPAVGALLAASHRSLCQDYEVSCPELDLMVELAAPLPGLRGARMTGGGFGGCTVNLVDAAHSAQFRLAIHERYAAKTGLRPEIYISKAAHGVQKVLEISEGLPA